MKLAKLGVMFLVLMMSFIFNVTDEAEAACVPSQTLDNDHGAINSSYNWYYGNWAYGSYHGDFNGDHRISASGSNGTTYAWRFSYCDGISRAFSVYLNHPNFTDPYADYFVGKQNYSGQVDIVHQDMNQRTAAGGWNRLEYTTAGSDSLTDLYIVKSSSGASAGADGAKVYHNY
ncbi:hypothetical protein CU633_19230 [Bacillus sp. V3-13]|uniref:hypothetical protein n=1 Tax=Bacillus sp. V3-13 TaxID=2053728 RepID=UPI000C788B9A|nr:hypothetical protein [Bacillus sp. V3-13]PLR75771.1 hypothetical protein CU633_19230 [Bacillus sp. V3-13]